MPEASQGFSRITCVLSRPGNVYLRAMRLPRLSYDSCPPISPQALVIREHPFTIPVLHRTRKVSEWCVCVCVCQGVVSFFTRW